jgi:hypothetical protein
VQSVLIERSPARNLVRFTVPTRVTGSVDVADAWSAQLHDVLAGIYGVPQFGARQFVAAALAVGGHQVLGEAVGVEQVEIADAVSARVVWLVDEIALPMRVWADRRLVDRAESGIENCGDMVASTAAHAQHGVLVASAAEVVHGSAGGALTFGRAQVG